MTRKHTVAFTEPSPDDLHRWMSRVQSDNLTRVSWWASFKLPSEAHAGCVGADLSYIDGVLLTRTEGVLLKVVFLKHQARFIVSLAMGHGGRYAGPFRTIG